MNKAEAKIEIARVKMLYDLPKETDEALDILLAQASLVDTAIEKLKSDREAAKKEYQITLSDFQDGKRAEIDELLKILEVNE